MRHDDHDRGMRAVARVREVREQDSRIGLLSAMRTVREREDQVATLRAALDEAAAPHDGTLDDFVTSRRLVTSAAVALREAEQRLASARTVATEAQQRWQADKARLRAIRHLLQQRALQRAETAQRAETREVDDIVARLHARTQAARASRAATSATAHAAQLALTLSSAGGSPAAAAPLPAGEAVGG